MDTSTLDIVAFFYDAFGGNGSKDEDPISDSDIEDSFDLSDDPSIDNDFIIGDFL